MSVEKAGSAADPTSVMLSRSISWESFEEIDPIISELITKIANASKLTFPLAREDARSVLAQALVEVEDAAYPVIDRLSTYEWIWLLRRLPLEVIPRSVESTPPYVLRVAQVLASRSRVLWGGINRKNSSAYFTVDRDKAKLVRDLVAAAIGVQRIHAMMRLVGKGAQLIQTEDSVLCIIQDTTLRSAVELFDQRTARGENFLSQVGIVDPDTKLLSGPMFPQGSYTKSTTWIPTNTNLLRSDDVRYVPRAIDIRLTARFIDLTQPQFADVLDILVVLDAIVKVARSDLASAINLLRTGYVTVSRQRLGQYIKRSITRLRNANVFNLHNNLGVGYFTAVNVIDRIRRGKPELLPLSSSPALIDAGGQMMLDGYSATMHLHTLLGIENDGGESSNLRAAAFEEFVQEIIDLSPCRPHESLRRLVGKTVRDAIGVITDIDCVAETPAYILLIDCKSKLRSHAF
jgi:hypothetical protein